MTIDDLPFRYSLASNPDALLAESGGLLKEHRVASGNANECIPQGLAGDLETEKL